MSANWRRSIDPYWRASIPKCNAGTARLDFAKNLLAASNVTIVTHISVSRDQDLWEATLTVDDLWRLRNKQLCLEDAQSLWKAWASIASPKAPDSARIKIVDLNGNELGGSRVWGGSLIWAQD